MRTLRVTLDDEREPFADDVIAESVIAILGELDLLIHDIVELSRGSSEVGRVRRRR
ncbi:hypothetical protein ACIP5Y_12330 [Nocardia sp. NPDC088792]|uniref:hypothetical protein n=1 Tax=Nocardia sp. NPDC088792 TaxID=3364332 RepID=UPI003825FC9C